jgi:hypothetical protein
MERRRDAPAFRQGPAQGLQLRADAAAGIGRTEGQGQGRGLARHRSQDFRNGDVHPQVEAAGAGRPHYRFRHEQAQTVPFLGQGGEQDRCPAALGQGVYGAAQETAHHLRIQVLLVDAEPPRSPGVAHGPGEGGQGPGGEVFEGMAAHAPPQPVQGLLRRGGPQQGEKIAEGRPTLRSIRIRRLREQIHAGGTIRPGRWPESSRRLMQPPAPTATAPATG